MNAIVEARSKATEKFVPVLALQGPPEKRCLAGDHETVLHHPAFDGGFKCEQCGFARLWFPVSLVGAVQFLELLGDSPASFRWA